MKTCPRCSIHFCMHQAAAYKFGLYKLILIQKSLKATTELLDMLINFLPSTPDMHGKLSDTLENLRKNNEKISDFREWLETQIAINGEK